MDKRTILLNLQHHAKWLKDQTQSTVDGGYLAANVMIGCVQIINCCGQSIRQWVGCGVTEVATWTNVKETVG